MTADTVYPEELTPQSHPAHRRKGKTGCGAADHGRQTGLNIADRLHQEGYGEEQGVEIIGVDIGEFHITQDRQLFRDLVERIGVDQARSHVAKSLLQTKEIT